MKSIRKFAIFGVGFMGGSLCRALKNVYPRTSIGAYARSRASFRKLKTLPFLDTITADIAVLVADADMVVLAQPVETTALFVRKIAPFLKKGAIVFDVGSTKALIEKIARTSFPPETFFVGCHPLCGSEKSGAEFSRDDLYREAICLITSSPKHPATKAVANLWQTIGSRVVFITPQKHDAILSPISHVPHLVSFSLTKLLPAEYARFISGSFKDLTRISHSPASVWSEIFLSNRKNILRDMKKFIRIVQTYQKAIEGLDAGTLRQLIATANRKQKKISTI